MHDSLAGVELGPARKASPSCSPALLGFLDLGLVCLDFSLCFLDFLGFLDFWLIFPGPVPSASFVPKSGSYATGRQRVPTLRFLGFLDVLRSFLDFPLCFLAFLENVITIHCVLHGFVMQTIQNHSVFQWLFFATFK